MIALVLAIVGAGCLAAALTMATPLMAALIVVGAGLIALSSTEVG